MPKLKAALKKGLRVTTAPMLRSIPVRKWPAWVSRIHDLSVPRSVVPNPEPAPTGAANINILLQFLDRTSHLSGAVAECGVYRGATLVTMAMYLEQAGSQRSIWGLDSFQGFQHTLELEQGGWGEDPNKRRNGFADTSLELVRAKLHRFGLNNPKLVPGFFETSLKELPEQKYSFVHLDCDTYVAYRDCLHYFYPRMQAGGIIALDEYNDPPWPGCNQAVDEFLSDKPEVLEQVVQDNFAKYAIVKN